MKKKIIIALGLIIYGTLQAQETGSYLNFNVGAGLHNLSYNLQNGTEKGQFGYTLNAGYSYFFTPNWGIQTGLGFQSFNSLSTLNYLSSSSSIDTQGQSYLFRANFTNWKEKQQALFIDIPLAVQYKLPVTKKFRLLTSVGGKISIPVNATFKSTGGEFVTTGYYEKWNVLLSDLPQHGFSTFTNSFKGNSSLKPSFMAIADLGGLYKLSSGLDLYVGGYINYSLNNISKDENKLIFQPNGSYNGLLASSLASNVIPISFGVKVGLNFFLGQKKLPLKNLATPNESIQPVKPVELVQPVKPVEPVQPVEAVQPVKAVEPAQPVQPVEAVKPVEPVQSVKPAESIQPAESVQPIRSVQPVQPEITTSTVSAVVPGQEVAEAANVSSKVAVKEVPKELVKETPKDQVVEKTIETPKVNANTMQIESKKELPVQKVVKVDSAQIVDPFERAQKIAAAINLMFEFNSAEVINARKDKVKELSGILKANPSIYLRFVGHTCNIGTHEINLKLGLKRADNAKQEFVDLGVSNSQLIDESKAYDEPLVPNTSDENRAKNRRVEIKVFHE